MLRNDDDDDDDDDHDDDENDDDHYHIFFQINKASTAVRVEYTFQSIYILLYSDDRMPTSVFLVLSSLDVLLNVLTFLCIVLVFKHD